MILTIDFESRSTVDLKKRGLFVYWNHPETEIMCLGYAIDNQAPKLLIPTKFRNLISPANLEYELGTVQEIASAAVQAEKIIAHNSMFEFVGWSKKLATLPGWPELPFNRIYDTMAQCAYHALPLRLESACDTLMLPIRKDSQGHKIMLKLCKPRNSWKRERETDPQWMNKTYWHEKPEELERLFNYCGVDVEAERALYYRLPDLTPSEREIWLLDQKINLRGIPIDMESVKLLTDVLERRENEQQALFAQLTDGKVTGPRSYVALKNWINENSPYTVQSVSDSAVEEILQYPDLPANVKQVLTIKSELAKSSTAKFQTMINSAGYDGRVRGSTQYHGAGTGRFAGRNIQPQNLPRKVYNEQEYESIIYLLANGQLKIVTAVYDDPFYMASKCLRGSIQAPGGKQFLCADYSSIEGVYLAHKVQEEWVLDAYRAGKDVYRLTAAMCLNKDYDAIEDDERNYIGKVAELACGYGGAVQAVRQFGGKGTDQEILETIVRPWRDARPNTVSFWKGVENAAKSAVANPGRVFEFSQVQYCYSKEFLKCKLPSGRLIHYYKPNLSDVRTPWGEFKESVTYLKAKNGGAFRTPTHGGKLTENIIQACCRDFLTTAMVNLDKAGFDIVLTVHDEILAEVNEGDNRLEEFINIMTIVPAWAEGCPISADGWIGKRFRK